MTSRDEAIDWVGLFVDVLDLGHPFVEPWNELEAKVSEVKEDLSGVLLDLIKTPAPLSELQRVCPYLFDKGGSDTDLMDGGQRILNVGFRALLAVALWQGKARAILNGPSINQMAIPQIASSLQDLLEHVRETGQLETYKKRFGDSIKSLEDQLASLDDSSARKIVIVVHMMDYPNAKPRIRMLLEKMQPHQTGAREQANRYLY